MVSSIFKQNMYSGVYEDLDPLETPINLFETNPKLIARYRLMKASDIYEVEVMHGGCIYVPAYYWYQTET